MQDFGISSEMCISSRVSSGTSTGVVEDDSRSVFADLIGHPKLPPPEQIPIEDMSPHANG